MFVECDVELSGIASEELLPQRSIPGSTMTQVENREKMIKAKLRNA